MYRKLLIRKTARNVPKYAWLSTITFIISLALFDGQIASALVHGECVNCHTMHNSQNGLSFDPVPPVAGAVSSTGPRAALLRNSCVGCHSSTVDEAIKDPGGLRIPVVYNTVKPTFGEGKMGLAAGNFYWVEKEGDVKGHNVFEDNPDDIIGSSPDGGAPGDNGRRSCGVASCHMSLTTPTPQFQGRQGCSKCHMVSSFMDAPAKGYHHAGPNTEGGPLNKYPWYRFLNGHNSSGVCGYEDNDWQATNYGPGTTDHNEYIGVQTGLADGVSLTYGNGSMSAYCCGCHPNFHTQNEQNDGSGPWIRHPSDAYIPADGEYGANVGPNYSLNSPVARNIISTDPAFATKIVPKTTVTADGEKDMVMCLSCHKAHGSPYNDMLRWNYDDMKAGSGYGNTGCFYCHTQKDNP